MSITPNPGAVGMGGPAAVGGAGAPGGAVGVGVGGAPGVGGAAPGGQRIGLMPMAGRGGMVTGAMPMGLGHMSAPPAGAAVPGSVGVRTTESETFGMHLKKLRLNCYQLFDAASMLLNPAMVTQSQTHASEFGQRLEEVQTQCDTIHDDITYMQEWYKIVRQTPDREIEAWLRTITVLEQTQELHESFVQALERSVNQPSSMETLITGLATSSSDPLLATKGKDADPRAHAAEAVESSPKLSALLGSPTPSPSAGLASMATTPNVNSVGDKEEEETAEGEMTADSEAPEGEAEAGAEDAPAVEAEGDEDENMLEADADDAPHDAETTAAAVAELGIPSATEGDRKSVV